MAKTIQTRVQNKHDIEANWLLATNFVPLDEAALEELIDDTNTKIENLTSIWIGTRAQWEEAKDNIATGTVVILTDDNNIAAGGSGSGDAAGGTTSAKLGTAVLGTMILGQE